jgi:hypothetical protein
MDHRCSITHRPRAKAANGEEPIMSTYLRNLEFDCRREEDGNLIVFNAADGKGFTMNETSYRIWELCDGTRDGKSITAELLKAHASTVPPNLGEIIESHLSILVLTGFVREQ